MVSHIVHCGNFKVSICIHRHGPEVKSRVDTGRLNTDIAYEKSI